MPSSYTNLLGLVLPVTGELSGTWGNTVNAQLTQLVEDSIAGFATASVTSGDWTLTTAGSGLSNQARMAILVPTGTPGVSRDIFAPKMSKVYFVVNKSDAAVVLRGGPGTPTTGVAIPASAARVVFWDNAASDFVLVSATNANVATDVAGGTVGQLLYQAGASDTAFLSVGTAGQLLTSQGAAAPIWTDAGGQVFSVEAAVATNALTIRLNPTPVTFRNSTANNGVSVTRTVAVQISMTVSSGSTLGTGSGIPSRLQIIAIDNAGTVELAINNVAGGLNLNETGVVSTTAEGGAGGADSAAVVYSTTARSNVPYRVVGYLDITEATAGTWATAPTLVQGAGGRAFGIMEGTLLQTQLVSGASFVDFVTGFSSRYDQYVLRYSEMAPGTDGSDLWLRFSTDGGSTFASGASDYAHTRYGNTDAGAAGGFGGAVNDSKMQLSLGNASAATAFAHGEILLAGFNSTTRHKGATSRTTYARSGQTIADFSVGGLYKNTAVVNGTRLLMSSGTISGVFSLYGINK